MSDLLLYLALVDLREFSDEELRDYLELLLGSLMAACGELSGAREPQLGDENRASASELREQIFQQLEAAAPDREQVAAWVQDYPELLPESVCDLEARFEQFDAFLEALFEEEELEKDPRLERFRRCLDLLDDDCGWQQRSQAARGLATLEEELCMHRDAYVAQPKSLAGYNSVALVAHMNLMDGFDTWQDAFRQVHQGQLDEAWSTAFEGTCLFHATERWPRQLN